MKGRSRRLHRPCFVGLLLVILMAGPARSTALAHFWSQRFGDASNQVAYSVATDPAGNVFLAGYFQGTVSFGGANLTSAGSFDVFLAKFNSAGVHQWSLRFGDANTQFGTSVATDALGNVYLTGYYQGAVNFGGTNFISAGGSDIFLAMFDSEGQHHWSQSFGDANNQVSASVASDAAGNVYLTGYFFGTVHFGFGGALLTSAGGYDIFLAKFDPGGFHQWSQSFGDASSQYSNSVAIDASGNACLTGFFQGTMNLGGGNLTSAGGNDVFLAKFSSAGVHQWSKRFGDASDQDGFSTATDASGNVFLAGGFDGTMNLGGGNLTGLGSFDGYIAKFNTAGVHQWSQSFGDASGQSVSSVATDATGNVYLAGSLQGTMNLGGGNLTSAGGNDVFLAKFSASGAHQWSRNFGDASNQYGQSVATDAAGHVHVAGYYAGTLNFGGTDLIGAGGNDIYLAKIASDFKEPVIQSIVDVGNDQGREVKIAFRRSGFDDPVSPTEITQYEAYRRDKAAPAAAMAGTWDATPSRRELLAAGWQFVGATPAHGGSSYLMGVPTIADSTIAAGQYYSVFFVRAATPDLVVFYDSPVDSGYSVDNLAPPAPAHLAFSAGMLSWRESTAADFDYFSIYGSSKAVFDASAVLIDYTTGTAFNVSGSPHAFYYLTATDFSGNEGKASRLNTLSGVGGTPTSYTLAVNAYPNPFNPQTTIRYDVPAHGRVVVGVYDARGARITTLVDAEKDAGSYSMRWEGRDEHGAPASSGIYFVRVEFGGNTTTRKIALVK